MFPIAQAAYHSRGGKDRRSCPAGRSCRATAAPTRTSRVDAAGELYIFSKTDGMIRAVVGGTVK